jgi:prepilin-type N-terminal cleavage/methylation domain-containing protein/prepilin-type processing-associated H-X9-DG protein
MTMSSQLTRAFTLIELLVVIAVIAILVTIAYPVYTGLLERGKATKDMNNLRQLGIATQLYMNDNNGVLPGAATVPPSWMSQLYPKYLSSWYVLISPFDPVTNPAVPGRTALDNNANSAISYGINGTVGVMGMSTDRISKPTVFILFAPAQDNSAAVNFQGIANTTSPANLAASPNITVVGIGGGQATSVPGGTNATSPHGTHSSRAKINALFADWHVENMPWSGTSAAFTNITATATDPDGSLRWTPYTPYP